MPRIWIDDGLTLTEIIEPNLMANGEKGLPLKISFRPPMADVLLRLEEAESYPGPDRVTAIMKFVGEHLVGWDLSDAKDQPVPVNPESVAMAIKHIPPEYIYVMRRKIGDSISTWAKIAKN